MSEPEYRYIKGQGWVPSIKPPPPKTWDEQCARICPLCTRNWGEHSGWTCPSRWDGTRRLPDTAWPEEDRWERIGRSWR